jgi:hypothetical protein
LLCLSRHPPVAAVVASVAADFDVEASVVVWAAARGGRRGIAGRRGRGWGWGAAAAIAALPYYGYYGGNGYYDSYGYYGGYGYDGCRRRGYGYRGW